MLNPQVQLINQPSSARRPPSETYVITKQPTDHDSVQIPSQMHDTNKTKQSNPINYKNGKKVEPAMFNYTNYYNHREKLPQHYNPLLQYLNNTEVKFHNDNLFENSPIGMPTRAQILRERAYHLPILKETQSEKAKYRRKLEETQNYITSTRRKYDFTTYDQFSSHYFLTGARYNRNDTIDSKILNKYGVFVHRQKPELVYIKSNQKALESFKQDLSNMNSFILNSQDRVSGFKSKSVQTFGQEK